LPSAGAKRRRAIAKIKAARKAGRPVFKSYGVPTRPGRNGFLRPRCGVEGDGRSRLNKEMPPAWNSRAAALDHGAYIRIFEFRSE
jgi:hypothetical protein